MSEKPILFSTPMVQAILSGNKTMTRRVIKPQPEFESGFDYPHEDELGIYWKREESYSTIDELIKELIEKCPYQSGDILWVRETWGYQYNDPNSCPRYKATSSPDEPIKWRPSIHMPRSAARLFLEIKNIRVERLRDITEEDAKAEGIVSYWAEPHRDDAPFIGAAKGIGDDLCLTRREAFQQLWNSLNAKRGYGWDINPWVWVVEFERTEVKNNG